MPSGITFVYYGFVAMSAAIAIGAIAIRQRGSEFAARLRASVVTVLWLGVVIIGAIGSFSGSKYGNTNTRPSLVVPGEKVELPYLPTFYGINGLWKLGSVSVTLTTEEGEEIGPVSDAAVRVVETWGDNEERKSSSWGDRIRGGSADFQPRVRFTVPDSELLEGRKVVAAIELRIGYPSRVRGSDVLFENRAHEISESRSFWVAGESQAQTYRQFTTDQPHWLITAMVSAIAGMGAMVVLWGDRHESIF